MEYTDLQVARFVLSIPFMKALLIAALLAAATAACGREAPSSPPSTKAMSQPPTASASAAPPSSTTLPAGLSRVADPSQVCMVNNQYMGKPQIPVEVEGRMYFGCCAMCKDRLHNDPSSRLGQDPVTGESVDKSKAVIVQDASGKVMYFAGEATLSQYRPVVH